MVRTASLILLSAAFASAYGLVTETSRQGRIQWKRGTSGQQYPTEWEPVPASSNKPEWTQALNAAIAAGKIPNIPPSTLNAAGQPAYPAGTPDPCNWTNTQCEGKTDVSNAPDGWLGVQFDDGPTPASPNLTKFLSQNDIAATHFLIGSNILDYPGEFDDISKIPNQHLAVHTWSHGMSTTLSNEVMLGELGWTMQIIYDRSGKIPAWWRAPMGDLDDRVRAIATEVFGLTAVSWNFDSNDWCMNEKGHSECAGEVPGEDYASITNYIDSTFAKSAKSPGIIMLEHELTSYSVNAFIQHTWAGIQQYKWNHNNIPSLFGLPWYANSFNNTTPNSSQNSLVKSAIVANGNSNGTSSSSSSSSSSAASSAASSAVSTASSTTGRPGSSTSTLSTSQNGAATSPSSSPAGKSGATVSSILSASSMLALVGGSVVAALAL